MKNIWEKGHFSWINIYKHTKEKKIGDDAFGILFSLINNTTKKKYALKN